MRIQNAFHTPDSEGIRSVLPYLHSTTAGSLKRFCRTGHVFVIVFVNL